MDTTIQLNLNYIHNTHCMRQNKINMNKNIFETRMYNCILDSQ